MAKNKYGIWYNKRQKEINNIPFGFAFDDKQFDKMLIKMGLTQENYKTELLSIGGGGFIKKSDSEEMHETFDRHHKELEENLKDEDFLYDAFRFELANHEYCIREDVTDTLECLELTEEDIEENPMMKRVLKKAIKDYMKYYEEHYND